MCHFFSYLGKALDFGGLELLASDNLLARQPGRVLASDSLSACQTCVCLTEQALASDNLSA